MQSRVAKFRPANLAMSVAVVGGQGSLFPEPLVPLVLGGWYEA
jgi:hypothetical protein